MKKCITVLLFYCVVVCHGQEKTNSMIISPAIKKIADSIARYNVLEGAVVGYGGRRSTQWGRLERLRRLATSDELRQLTNYANGVVRCYAFQALTTKQDTAVVRILLAHLTDDEMISTMYYDMGGWTKVGDYFISSVSDDNDEPNRFKLIYGKGIKLSAKYRLLTNLKVNPKYYTRVREIAIDEKIPEACIALSRFQKREDLAVIGSFFNQEKTEYYGIYAVREFPDSVFYPKLVKVFENEWRQKLYSYPKWRILYQALAKYPNQQTLKLFERTVNSNDNFRRNQLGEYLMAALIKYPNPLFEVIKNSIRIDDFNKEGVNRDMDMEK